jgi:hypothetical protein
MKTRLRYFFILSFALAFSVSKINAQTLIQFWDFNQIHPIASTAGDSLGTEFSYINIQSVDSANSTYTLGADYYAAGLTPGHILYTRPGKFFGSTGERDSILDQGAGGSFYYDYSSSAYSYFTSSDSGGAVGNGFIRARNPSDSCEMYISIPTTGYKNISMQFSITTSGAGAAQYNIFSYSTNGGTSWNNLTTAMDTFNQSGVNTPDSLLVLNSFTTGSAWYPVQINFSSDPAVNNNGTFVLRFRIAGTNSSSNKKNVRYDNFAIWGTSTTAGVNDLSVQAAGYNVYPNPVGTSVNITSRYTGAKVITLYNVVGQAVSVTESQDLQTSINTTSLNAGVYFVEIKEVSTGNKYTVKVVKE